MDVERVDRAVDIDQLGRRYFSPPELVALRRCGEGARTRFFELWTLKEAVIKAIGVGLSQPLDSMTFDLDEERVIAFAAPRGIDATKWRFALYAPAPDARLAVAVCGVDDCTLRWEARPFEPPSGSSIHPLRTTRG